MAVTVAGTNITFNDGSVQTTQPMKLLGEVSNSMQSTHTFSGLGSYSRLILVWECNQYSGPSGSVITAKEQSSSIDFTTRSQASIIRSGVANNNVIQITQATGNSNILNSFSSGSCMTSGLVVFTRIRPMSSGLNGLWNVDVATTTSSEQYRANLKLATNSVGTPLSIGSIYMALGLVNYVNIRIYGME